jgi:hypothetical protein
MAIPMQQTRAVAIIYVLADQISVVGFGILVYGRWNDGMLDMRESGGCRKQNEVGCGVACSAV